MRIEYPHLRVLARLNRLSVDYLLIGVLAINHYADDPASAYSTQDCDVLLKPDLGNLRRAVRALLAEGYELSAGSEPLPAPDALVLRRILERRASIVGKRGGALGVDLVLDAGGLSFSAWRRGRREFRVGTILVPCASLEKLLAAKERAARPKDKAFLKLYRAGLQGRAQPVHGRRRKTRS